MKHTVTFLMNSLHVRFHMSLGHFVDDATDVSCWQRPPELLRVLWRSRRVRLLCQWIEV